MHDLNIPLEVEDSKHVLLNVARDIDKAPCVLTQLTASASR